MRDADVRGGLIKRRSDQKEARMKPELEICCYSVESVRAAARGGANRVELCASPPEGGVTPSYGCIELAREVPGVALYVIIRPRGGDFCYSREEFRCMKRDVLAAQKLGADGVVLGILTPEGNIDQDRTRELVELAGGMDVTFHRAFDMCSDPMGALEVIRDCGIRRILSSGTRNTVNEGMQVLAELVRAGRVPIMAGSGVNADNLDALYRIGIRQFHSSASKAFPSPMQYRNPHIQMGKGARIDEYAVMQADEALIGEMRRRLDRLYQQGS